MSCKITATRKRKIFWTNRCKIHSNFKICCILIKLPHPLLNIKIIKIYLQWIRRIWLSSISLFSIDGLCALHVSCRSWSVAIGVNFNELDTVLVSSECSVSLSFWESRNQDMTTLGLAPVTLHQINFVVPATKVGSFAMYRSVGFTEIWKVLLKHRKFGYYYEDLGNKGLNFLKKNCISKNT